MIALVLQSAPKKDFAIAKVKEGATGDQMPRLSKEFESVNKLLAWRPVYTENPLSLASIYVGSPLVLSNAK